MSRARGCCMGSPDVMSLSVFGWMVILFAFVKQSLGLYEGRGDQAHAMGFDSPCVLEFDLHRSLWNSVTVIALILGSHALEACAFL